MCQLCASRTLSGVEKGLLSPTRTHSISPFTPQTPACKIRQTDSAKTITPPYTCMWSPPCTHPLHTHTYPKCRAGSYFPFSAPVFAHIYTHSYAQRAQSFNAILYVSLLLTHRTKQVIRAWVESSIHIVLSVCSQSAGLLHSDWTPLAAGRI